MVLRKLSVIVAFVVGCLLSTAQVRSQHAGKKRLPPDCANWDLDGVHDVNISDLFLATADWRSPYDIRDMTSIVNCFLALEFDGVGTGGAFTFAPTTLDGAPKSKNNGTFAEGIIAAGPHKFLDYKNNNAAFPRGSGSAGDPDCDSDVPVRGKFLIRHEHPQGLSADDFHFYMYQNDKPSIVVVGANAGSDAFDTVDVALDSQNHNGIGSGMGPPYHGAQVDMSGGSVADGETISVDVQLCMNERNCLKLADWEWTYDNSGNPPQPLNGRHGWRVKRPAPGGNGGNTQDAGGGGDGAQEGNGGGDGNHVHWICIENDDPANPLLVTELKVLASDQYYADIELINWGAIDPVKDKNGRPPVEIPPGGQWCFPFQTDGSYLNGHIYLKYDSTPVLVIDTAGGGPDVTNIGDHPNPVLSEDLDLDTLWDAYEEIHGLATDDDGSINIDNGPNGDPDFDGFLTGKEQDLLTDPTDPLDPFAIAPGFDVYALYQPVIVDFGTQLPPLPSDFFGPGSDPFTGPVEFVGIPLPHPDCPDNVTGHALVQRSEPVALPEVPASDQIPIEMVALSLQSTSPIEVTYNGGMTTQTFDVFFGLSPLQVAAGGLNVHHTHGAGGTFDQELFFPWRMVFTNTLSPSQQFFYDSVEQGLTDFLSVGLAPWQLAAPALQCPSCTTNFVCGYDNGLPTPFILQGGTFALPFVPGCVDAVPQSGDVLAGLDLLETRAGQLEFGFGNPPIPPDFFFPGSPQFQGAIDLVGVPLVGTTQCTGDIGNTDTIIEREGPASFDGSNPTIPIEIVEMNLQSTQPIDVGATQWDVMVTVSPSDPSSGQMTLTKDHAEGGVWTGTLVLQPTVVFTQVGAPSQQVTLDGAAHGTILPLTFTDVPWVYDNPDFNWDTVDCTSNFIPGSASPD